ncbi:short-chain dehydrogenase reductase family [Colletotrichum scovillei]|nr:short-chain dehydrogenase reductase family [Colletotrichum scovillei]
MSFLYKQVLLVGATSGIGAATADKLVENGVKVIAVGRRQERLDAFVKKHGSSKAASVRFDITDRAGLDDFVKRVVDEFPDLDCVFINSGIQSQIKLSEPSSVDLDAFREEINVNFLSVVDMSVKFLPRLQEKAMPTSLIITGTHLALIPAVTLPAYSASKAALHAFVYSLRQQLQGSSTKIIEIWPPLVQSQSSNVLFVVSKTILTRPPAELHDYMGEEKGRSMGMPVDAFTNETYKQLVSGTEHILVGSVGPEEPFLQLVKARQKQSDDLSKFMLSHP